MGTEELWSGTGFALDRLRQEVLDPLRAGGSSRFASYDWEAQAPRGWAPDGSSLTRSTRA